MKSRGIERRKCHRIEVAGAEVVFKKNGLFNLFSRSSGPCYLLNLSKGGVGFSTDVHLKPGQKVSITLILPDKSPLKLLGIVKWQSRIGFNQMYGTGVQFFPFTGRRGWNSYEVLEVLKNLEHEYIAN